MKFFKTAWAFAALSISLTMTAQTPSFYDLQANTLEGESFDFESLKGKRVLIVNTASKCGFTPQYAELEALQQSHGGEDFVILGFPCNDFGNQEPGSAEEIASFCQRNYGVSFTMMEKVHVKGDDIHPVYAWLTQADLNGVDNHHVGWNFHKFLVDEKGQLVASLRSGTGPDSKEVVNFAAGLAVE